MAIPADETHQYGSAPCGYVVHTSEFGLVSTLTWWTNANYAAQSRCFKFKDDADRYADWASFGPVSRRLRRLAFLHGEYK
jgi:hypothetical protein